MSSSSIVKDVCAIDFATTIFHGTTSAIGTCGSICVDHLAHARDERGTAHRRSANDEVHVAEREPLRLSGRADIEKYASWIGGS